jgi:2,3,4,5-tetrahydropyridine-2-carboxylate N-succinyltransferase
MNSLQTIIEQVGKQSFVTRRRQQKPLEVIELLDGKLRVAEPKGDAWQVNEWVKKAVVMYFLSRKWKHREFLNTTIKWKKKTMLLAGVRVVPGASARYGSYIKRSNYDAQLCKHWRLCR